MMKVGDVLLSVNGVSLTLGGKLVLRDLSLEIVDRQREGIVTGQVVGLLGPSGVGKTRLLRLIAGLDEPNAGTIGGHGGGPLDVAKVGYVFQDYPLLEHRSVESNLLLAGKLADMEAGAVVKRANQLLEHFNLTDRRYAFPKELSGGQRQRASIAQQLMAPRKFLLMDEPFSGLDPAALVDVSKLIVDAANLDDENTVILVTHDIRAALLVSDTLFVLGRDREGEKFKDGARVQFKYDLVERGLAYQLNLEDKREFAELERELRSQFRHL
jgi:polar amino acid transport system ATP-binding protein/sulfate transport system ATP-binding protein